LYLLPRVATIHAYISVYSTNTQKTPVAVQNFVFMDCLDYETLPFGGVSFYRYAVKLKQSRFVERIT
jgi:hypothetical protein